MSRPSFISSCLRARVGVMTLTSCGGLAFASSIAAGRTAANWSEAGMEAASPERRQACRLSVPPVV